MISGCLGLKGICGMTANEQKSLFLQQLACSSIIDFGEGCPTLIILKSIKLYIVSSYIERELYNHASKS